jgi:hypothetical protein
MQKKPHEWGCKAFVLGGISGFSDGFKVFAGGQSNTVSVGAPDLGSSGKVAMRLDERNYKIFFITGSPVFPLKCT